MPYQYDPNYSYTPANTYFPQMQQRAMPTAPPAQGGAVWRPVSSIEEAKNIQIQFDGGLYGFVNLASGEIYTKQFNFDTGSTDFTVYVKQAPLPPVKYATADELAELRRDLNELKEAHINAESNNAK